MKVQFKDWHTLKSLSLIVLMKLPLLSLTAIEEDALWEDRTRLKLTWNSLQLLNRLDICLCVIVFLYCEFDIVSLSLDDNNNMDGLELDFVLLEWYYTKTLIP